MTYESFDFKKENGIGHLKLNRGEEFNKMTLNFWYELPRVLDEIRKDTSLRALVLSSTGKHFCAGMDLANFGTLGTGEAKKDNRPDKARIGEGLYRVAMELQENLTKLEKLRIPVLCGIQGGCIGGGLDMATAADIRFASKDALVMHPGPMNRGVEIDTKLADDINVSLVKEQVELGVAVRMACLKLYCK